MDNPRQQLLFVVLIRGDLVVTENSDHQVESNEVVLTLQSELPAFLVFLELIEQDVRLADVAVVQVLGAHQEDSDIGLTHLCTADALVLRA